jgi:Ca2+-binding EF-hand superfamily protein
MNVSKVNDLFRNINSGSRYGVITDNEMQKALKRAAGGDEQFTKQELNAFLRKAGIPEGQREKIFDYLKGENGKVAMGDVKELLDKANTDGKAGWSKNEFKDAVGGLKDVEAIGFNRDRVGRDNKMNLKEFSDLAKEVRPELSKDEIEAAFDEVSKGDGSISRKDFKDEFGTTGSMSREKFGKKLDALVEDSSRVGWDTKKDGLSLDAKEFGSIAKKAGITDQGKIDELYDIIGKGNRISMSEWKDTLGDKMKMKPSELKDKLNKIYDDAQEPEMSWMDYMQDGPGDRSFISASAFTDMFRDAGYDVSRGEAKGMMSELGVGRRMSATEAKDIFGSGSNTLGSIDGIWKDLMG